MMISTLKQKVDVIFERSAKIGRLEKRKEMNVGTEKMDFSALTITWRTIRIVDPLEMIPTITEIHTLILMMIHMEAAEKFESMEFQGPLLP
jgi:hypothetical protein